MDEVSDNPDRQGTRPQRTIDLVGVRDYASRQDKLWGLAHATRESHDFGWNVMPASYFVYAYFLFDVVVEQVYTVLGAPRGRNDKTKERREKLIDTSADTYGDRLAEEFQRLLAHRHSDLERRVDDGIDVPCWSWLERHQPGLGGVGRRAITAQERNHFVEHMVNLSNGCKGDSRTWLKEVHSFIYKVRNRVMHGEKRPHDIIEDDQQKRFLLYTVIIHATLDLVWESANKLASEG